MKLLLAGPVLETELSVAIDHGCLPGRRAGGQLVLLLDPVVVAERRIPDLDRITPVGDRIVLVLSPTVLGYDVVLAAEQRRSRTP
jgi:hypothetical protein